MGGWGIISRRFHNSLIDVFANVAERIAQRTEFGSVCLSGGSFQNAVLTKGLGRKLTKAGLKVFTHTQVPPEMEISVSGVSDRC